MKKIQPTNFVLAFIIIISFIIFFRSLDNKETFEDQTEDKSLIALQDFTKFATKGDPGEKGSKGTIGNSGPLGPAGPRGEKGSDLEGAISSSGKLWLGGYNTGSSGISKDNEVQLRLAGQFGQGANGSTEGWTTYKLKIEGYEGTQKNCLVYPIYCRDRDGNVDFYLKNRNKDNSNPLLYIAGDLHLESKTGECSIKSEGNLKIECNDLKFNTKGNLILENTDYKGNRYKPDEILDSASSLIVNGITSKRPPLVPGVEVNALDFYTIGRLIKCPYPKSTPRAPSCPWFQWLPRCGGFIEFSQGALTTNIGSRLSSECSRWCTLRDFACVKYESTTYPASKISPSGFSSRPPCAFLHTRAGLLLLQTRSLSSEVSGFEILFRNESHIHSPSVKCSA